MAEYRGDPRPGLPVVDPSDTSGFEVDIAISRIYPGEYLPGGLLTGAKFKWGFHMESLTVDE